MKKYQEKFSLYATVTLLLIGLFSITYSYQNSIAQKNKLVEIQNSSSIPVAVLDRQDFDWGNIARGQIVEESFTLSNQGTGPLTINKIVTSCGCTTAELQINGNPATIPATIVPDDKATIDVKFDPDAHDSRGEVKRAVRIETNDPEHPFLVINLLANVK